MSKPRKTILPPFPKLYPELLDEWHSEKNNDLDPHLLSAGSSQRIWWKCKNDPTHEWATALGNRRRKGKGCPFCVNLVADLQHSLAALYPHLLKEWHPTKNQNLDPTKYGTPQSQDQKLVNLRWKPLPFFVPAGRPLPASDSLRIDVASRYCRT